MKHKENPFTPATYPAITLDKKLSLVEHELKARGWDDIKVLSIQAYLLCLCKEGYLKDGCGYERKEELYERYLRKAPDLQDWLMASFSAESVKDFLQDPEGVLAQGNPSLFKDTFQRLLNNQVRSGKSQYDFMQPVELTELIVSLSGYEPGMTIYNPYAGVASYASELSAGSRYFAEEKDPKVWALGVLRTLMDDCYSENYLPGDSLNSNWSGPFDVVISSPPFGRYKTEKKTFITYATELINNAEALLSERGRMVVVVPPSILNRHDFKKLRTYNLLSTIITLPGRLMYWTLINCTVLVLEKNKESEGITLVEGSSFFSPGGRFTNTLNIKGLQEAMKCSDPTYVVKVSIDDIKKNDFRLLPMFYLDTPETLGPTVRLSEMGTFLRLRPAKEKVQKGICIKDLSMGPDLNEVKPKILAGSTVRFRRLEQSALLISANRKGMKMGLVSADPEHPVFISELIYAFAPDPRKADIRFIAQEIQKLDGYPLCGSSVFFIRQEELAAYPIRFLPLEEQIKEVTINTRFTETDSLYILNEKALDFSITDNIPKRTVVWVGPLHEDFPFDALRVKKEFNSGNIDMLEWLRKNKSLLDAVIIYHAGAVKAPQIALIYNDYPRVFIISDHQDTLENELDIIEDIKDRCFQRGYEKELLERLESEIREDETPEGKIRRRFAEEWEAIKNIDARFPRKDSSLESLFMEILLAAEDPKKHINGNTLRTIRDTFFLEKMEDYGLIPPKNKTFDRGAQMNLIADLSYSNDERCYFLNRELIPSPLNLMATATVKVLNRQSHEFDIEDNNLQWALVHVLLGLFCQMGKMIDQGLFEEDSKDKNRQYWTDYDSLEFKSGQFKVRVKKDNYGKEYFYADNIHLNNKLCKNKDIKEGDFVYISTVKTEKHPIDNNIVFYAPEFEKI